MIRFPALIGLSLMLPAAARAQTAPPVQSGAMPAGQNGNRAPAYPAQGAAHGVGLTLPVYQAKVRDRMMRLDTDHDGRISPAEFAARAPDKHGPARDPQRGFARYDQNHDGFIEPQEIDAMTARHFAKLDADHDGVVSRAERMARHGGEMPAGH